METFPTLSVKPSYPLTKIPLFKTDIVSYGAGVEQRLIRIPENCCKYRYKVSFDEGLTLEDKQIIVNFFLARHGSLEEFEFVSEDTNDPGSHILVFDSDELNIEYFEFLLYRFGIILLRTP